MVYRTADKFNFTSLSTKNLYFRLKIGCFGQSSSKLPSLVHSGEIPGHSGQMRRHKLYLHSPQRRVSKTLRSDSETLPTDLETQIISSLTSSERFIDTSERYTVTPKRLKETNYRFMYLIRVTRRHSEKLQNIYHQIYFNTASLWYFPSATSSTVKKASFVICW